MDKEVKIYFKVDGVEQYITSLDELEEALGQVEGALDDTTRATKELEEAGEQLDSMEQKMASLEGGIKVLAGSFQGLAGAAGLLGFEDNEFFKELEANVVNILALGEGAKNLAEGLPLLAKNQKIATAAQKAFNLAANANPYILIAGVIATAAGALLVWKMNAEEAEPPTADLADEIKRLSDEQNATNLDALIDRVDNLRKAAFGEDRTQVDNAIDLVAELTDEIQASAERENQLLREASEVQDETFQERLRNSQRYTDEELQQRIEKNQKILDDEETNNDTRLFIQSVQDALLTRQLVRAEQDRQFQLTEQLRIATEARDKIIEDANQPEYFEVDKLEEVDAMINRFVLLTEQMEKTGEEAKKLKPVMKDIFPEAQEELDDFATEYYKAFNQFMEEPETWRNLLIRDTTAGFNFINDIATIFTKDSEKRAERQFKINKALSLSNAIINTAAGVTDALAKDATFPGSRFISAAAVAASGAAQIATILRQKFEGGGSNLPDEGGLRNPVGALQYNFGQQAGEEIQPGEFSGGQQPEPVRAYVLVSDVNTAQQTNQQIENLARL